MVAPIRDLVNITSYTSATHETILNMSTNNDIVMGGNIFDCFFHNASNNYNEVQGHSLAHNAHSSKTSSMSSSECEKSYTKRMKR